jgi:acylphosphatase
MTGSLKGIVIIVSGVVQGVGFRWFVHRTATRYALKGFVRNLPDGSVETYAEGDDTTLKQFLEEVRIGPSYAHVTAVKVDWIEYKGKYKEFRIEL